jgi:hypothetical protein
MIRPFSQACENNKQAILHKIRTVFNETNCVWEIGSGTGQHACYFAEHLPHLIWQATDRDENLSGIDLWLLESGLNNIPKSLALNVREAHWPCQQIEAVFTANTLHIMSWQAVEDFFIGLARYLTESAVVCIYGSFKYAGEFTSKSNAQFDLWLKERDASSGIRDIEAVAKLAKIARLSITDDFTMPANNRLLVLRN